MTSSDGGRSPTTRGSGGGGGADIRKSQPVYHVHRSQQVLPRGIFGNAWREGGSRPARTYGQRQQQQQQQQHQQPSSRSLSRSNGARSGGGAGRGTGVYLVAKDEASSKRDAAARKGLALLNQLDDGFGAEEEIPASQASALSGDDDDGADADAGRGSSSLIDADSNAARAAESPTPLSDRPRARCPVCTAPVDADLQDECALVSTQLFKKRSAFCQKHRRKEAMATWTDRGYPVIDWDGLAGRIASHLATLEAMIAGHKRSIYREMLQAQAEDDHLEGPGRRGSDGAGPGGSGGGKASTMKKFRVTVESKGLETISTGYYGPRGAKIM
ncbi:hypothetical protein KEM52_001515 [Ascosphaera acerosa]|nr:hypothetical protein KEM52_001515 [Ascosphaera acerosa]